MNGSAGWIKATVTAAVTLTTLSLLAACASYPQEPQYSIRANQPSAPSQPAYPGQPGQPYPGAMPAHEAPLPSTAPIGNVEGGALPPPANSRSLNGGPYRPPVTQPAPSSTEPDYAPPSYNPPSYNPPSYNPPSDSRPAVSGGAVAYVIQPGDTISGVGRRFQTPVQGLIDLNTLGPRAAISPGQRIILPDAAVDTGPDPYAKGPAPIGVTVPSTGTAPPPPTPPSGNAALPPAPRPATVPVRPTAPPPVQAAPQTAAPATPQVGPPPSGPVIALQWPVRGDIVRRFGPVGMGERNNGINIGASAGAPVVAAAAGRVAYVGDALVGQGLTVLIVHRDGWRSVYGHLGSATVTDGADVHAGQQIGTVGLTAGDGRPSMHFETRRMQGDEPVAIDPLTVLPR